MKEEEFDFMDAEEVTNDVLEYLQDEFELEPTKALRKEINEIFMNCVEKDIQNN